MEYIPNKFKEEKIMLKRFVNWCNKPWTNGTYLKLVAIYAAIYGVVIAACAVYVHIDKITAFIKKPFLAIKAKIRG